MRPLAVLFLTILFVAFVAPAPAPPDEKETMSRLKTRAEVFVNTLITGRTSSMRGEMNETMRKALTDENAKRIFGDLFTRGGRLESVEPAQLSLQPDGAVVAMVPLVMTKNTVAAQVVFERQAPLAKITGFSILPWNAPETKKSPLPPGPLPMPPPAYADGDLFTEKAVEIPAPGGPLPGLLTMPKTASAKLTVPGVVLIPGAGPLDADASIGRTRPFRDIAQGLAANGVATIRFEKRERVEPEKFAPGSTYAVDDVFARDAVAAAEFLKAQTGVDASRITIAGHDMGGVVAPLVAELAGAQRIALLAPQSAPVDQYVVRSLKRLSASLPADNPLTLAIPDAESLVQGTLDPEGALLGQPVALWKGLRQSDPAGRLRTAGRPTALFFGGTDVFLPEEERATWDGVLADLGHLGHRVLVPGCNHVFVPVEGEPALAQLGAAGNVDERLVTALARFVISGNPGTF